MNFLKCTRRNAITAPNHLNSIGNRAGRKARSTSEEEDELRKPRKFCDGGGVFCTLYRAIQGESAPHQMAERREELNVPR